VVSLLALFVALGGASYAAIKITGKNVKNGSLTGQDIEKHSIPLNRLSGTLPAGQQGPKGDPGTNGATGTNGTNASTHVVVRSNFSNTTHTTVSCNAGETVTGGGAYASAGVVGSKPVYPSGPDGVPATGWEAYASAVGEGTYAYVLCASP
jgi:hypothetical protein